MACIRRDATRALPALLPLLLAAAWAGCSSEAPADPGADDAGLPDTAVPPAPEDAAIDDAGRADAAVDCARDVGDDGVPSHLECTGLFVDIVKKTVAASAAPYEPAFPFWSDGAEKSRWLHLPDGATIDATDPDEWVFPVGTKAWKEFRLAGKRVETRYFVKQTPTTWLHATYRWSDDERSARRITGSEKVPFGDAGYEIVANDTCDQCHFGKVDRLLGVDAVELGLPGASGLTLDALTRANRIAPALPQTALTLPDDATGKSAEAMGRLHANCGLSCHSASPSAAAAFVSMRLRLKYGELTGGAPDPTATELYTTTVGVPATARTIPDAGTTYRIAPGDPATSAIAYLMGQRGSGAQMPPIGSHVVDSESVGHVGAWISALPPP